MRLVKSGRLQSLLFGIAITFGATGPAWSQAIEINLGHVLSEQSTYQIGAMKFKEVLERRAPGKVKVNLFPSSGLGGEVKLIQGLRSGTVEAMIAGQPTLENTVTEYRILSLPYIFDDQAQATRLLQGDLGRKLLTVLPKYNIVGLGWGNVFERNVVTAKKPVTSLKDALGMKIRVVQSPGYVEAYKAIDMQPTPIAYAELFLALQNGVVDASELGADQVISDGFVDAVKFYNFTRMHQLPSIMLFSKPKFDSYPKDIQDFIMEAGREGTKAAAEAQRANIEAALRGMEAKKIVLHRPDLVPFRAAARKAWGPIVSSVPGGQQILADIEAAKK